MLRVEAFPKDVNAVCGLSWPFRQLGHRVSVYEKNTTTSSVSGASRETFTVS